MFRIESKRKRQLDLPLSRPVAWARCAGSTDHRDMIALAGGHQTSTSKLCKTTSLTIGSAAYECSLHRCSNRARHAICHRACSFAHLVLAPPLCRARVLHGVPTPSVDRVAKGTPTRAGARSAPRTARVRLTRHASPWSARGQPWWATESTNCRHISGGSSRPSVTESGKYRP